MCLWPLNIATGETLLLAAIQMVKTLKIPDTSVSFYIDEGHIEVVDLHTIQCVVGRVRDTEHNFWGIIDQSGPLTETTFTD